MVAWNSGVQVVRVKVWNGDKSEYLGEGDYNEDVTVYFIGMPDGSIRSMPNAEEEPPFWEVPEGGKVMKTDGNPKIILDKDSNVVYGCQVWWEPLHEMETMN